LPSVCLPLHCVEIHFSFVHPLLNRPRWTTGNFRGSLYEAVARLVLIEKRG
jgi:hypothetical protein